MKFGENLKSLRKSKNISQELLAEKVGVSRQSVSKWETGDAYPEMNNIIALCTIFKCNINDLVNNNMIDLDSLDEEVKMSVVKFEKEKQNKMKGFSKAIYIIARIFKIVSIVGIVFVLLGSIVLSIVLPNITFDIPNQKVNVFNHQYDYQLFENRILINEYPTKGISIETNLKVDDEVKFINFMNESILKKESFIINVTLLLETLCIISYLLFKTLELLFINIHNDETPFKLENVEFIKKISLYLLLFVLIEDVVGGLLSIFYSLNLNITFNFSDYLFIGIIYVLSYIFDYGYQIQLDSKGRMYGDVNE